MRNASELWIEISIPQQRLWLRRGDDVVLQAPVSTAVNGPGERMNSECTPRGRHIVRARIGAGCPANMVFVGRRSTGEIYSPALARDYPGRDWILTRILWLSGLEVGRNRLGDVDTMRRYIYIHGTPDTTELSQPGSRGCVRMANDDIIRLFDQVPAGTLVVIND